MSNGINVGGNFFVGLVAGIVIGILVGIVIKEIIGKKLTTITRDNSGRIIEVLEMQA